MFCNQCGQENSAGSSFCARCGQPLSPAAAVSPEAGTAPPAPGTPPADAKTDGKAVASLILGVLSLTIFSVLAGIPAVILGHVSRSNIKKSMGKLKGEGMALAGLILGYISFAAIPFILIIAAIAIPNLLRARISANEAGAVRSLRDVNQAVVTYVSDKQAFPAELSELGPAGAQLIRQEVASGQHAGYRFSYFAVDTDQDQVADGYFVSARPITPGSTGVRTFCTDQTGIIRSAPRGQDCTTESEPL